MASIFDMTDDTDLLIDGDTVTTLDSQRESDTDGYYGRNGNDEQDRTWMYGIDSDDDDDEDDEDEDDY